MDEGMPDAGSKDSDGTVTAPLSDVRVLDLTRVVSGPFASQVLGDLGAEILRIEPVPARRPSLPEPGTPLTEQEAFSWGINRNKRSLSVDLKAPAGRDLVLDLVEHA